MSYELYLVRTFPGEAPSAAVDRALEAAAEAPDSRADADDLLGDELSADSPLDVEAGPDHLFVAIPYIRSPDAAETLFREVFAGLRTAQSRSGWTAFDPQLERALDLTTDLPAVVERFEDTIAARGEFA